MGVMWLAPSHLQTASTVPAKKPCTPRANTDREIVPDTDRDADRDTDTGTDTAATICCVCVRVCVC